MNTPSTTICIVDDAPAVRDALTLMIEQEGFAVHAFDSAETFLDACRSEHPYGCAIIDVRMPGMDGLQLQEELSKRAIPLPIIFLTGHGNIPMSVRAIKAGAMDFLTKPVSREQLLSSIRSVIQSNKTPATQIAADPQAMSLISGLTGREQEVMALAVQGHPNKEIARRLGISHRTVEIHKSRVMQKTGAPNLLALARIAQEAGLSMMQ